MRSKGITRQDLRCTGKIPGLPARQLAVRLVAGVIDEGKPLDRLLEALLGAAEFTGLEARDRALARAVAAATLRRCGELEGIVGVILDRPLPAGSGRLQAILLTAAAQLLCLDMPAHAVVNLAVEMARRDRRARRHVKLVNAVLRRVCERGRTLLAARDPVRANIPDWLWRRWCTIYGGDTARRIAEASLREAPLDVCVKTGAAAELRAWAEKLGGHLLPTGCIRLAAHGRIEDMPGYADGAWWVQDAAAQLVARLAGDVAGRRVVDLCAAPGGKTAALAAAGARVTAVDVAPRRLDRLRHNLNRLRLAADIVEADATTWSPGTVFDAVILDAPCTATGTIRRHPDILRRRQPPDIGRNAELQQAMLRNAARLVRPGGVLVYSVCSLEPEEGCLQAGALLAAAPDFERMPIGAAAIGASPEWITSSGELRTLPFHLDLEPRELSGMDGFYAALLRRTG
jgi:16S rRNA (cytosine967-C5)-methyltransferase